MPPSPKPEAMLKAIRQSGLIDPELLRQRVETFRENGVSLDDPNVILTKLVETGDLTNWQADKIKQGKNKGFFLGKYRLLSLLGRGGMSSVYLAEHVLMRRRCAIKVLPVKRVDESSYLGRFHREAQAVAALDHPNIVRAYDVDSDDGHGTTIHFLVMEYVDGRNLQTILEEDGVCDFAEAVDYMRQACDGLAHAHEAGFVHRDIKPGNLLVDPKGVVKLLDLGLARYFSNSEEETSLTIQHDEKVLGTADYLAPEQALNSHEVDSRADIYALGCTFYFLLTGHPPFETGTLAQKLLAHQTQQPPSIVEKRPDTPASLQLILEKMMAKKADERYQTCKELADELSDWLVENGHEELLDSRLQRRSNDSARKLSSSDSRVRKQPASTKLQNEGLLAESPAESTKEKAPPPVIEEPVQADVAATETTPEAASPEGDVQPIQPADEAEEPETAGDGFGAFLAGLEAGAPPAPPEESPVPQIETESTEPVGDESSTDVESDAEPEYEPENSAEEDVEEEVQEYAEEDVGEPEIEPDVPEDEEAESHETEPLAETPPPADVAPDAPSFDFLNNDFVSPAATEGVVESIPDFNFKPTHEESAASEAVPVETSQPESTVQAENVDKAEPAPVSETPPPSVSQSRTSRSRKRPKKKSAQSPGSKSKLPIIGAAVLVVALVVGGGWAMGLFGGGDSNGDGQSGNGMVTDDNDGSSGNGNSGTPSELITGEIKIGKDGNFRNISSAIAYIKKRANDYTGDSLPKIVVAPGTELTDRIEIDNSDFTFPKGVEVICEGSPPALLKSDGTNPVMTLRGVEAFHMSGFRIDAGGHGTAIRLGGYCVDLVISNLDISGFTKLGIQAEGIAGLTNGPVKLDRMKFTPKSTSATGISLAPGETALADIQLTGCRFIGPMSIGVQSTGSSLSWIQIRNSIFHETETAISFSGQSALLQEIQLANNTFHEVGRGIVFESQPGTGSSGIGIYRNLFASPKGPQLVVGDGSGVKDFLKALSHQDRGSQYNWTTGQNNSKANDFDLFRNSGKVNLEGLSFVSTDPNAGDFLKPTNRDLEKAVASKGKFEKYIGAVAP